MFWVSMGAEEEERAGDGAATLPAEDPGSGWVKLAPVH